MRRATLESSTALAAVQRRWRVGRTPIVSHTFGRSVTTTMMRVEVSSARHRKIPQWLHRQKPKLRYPTPLLPSTTAARRAVGSLDGADAAMPWALTAAERQLLEAPHAHNNVPEAVRQKLGAGLLHRPRHPLCLLKKRIRNHFAAQAEASEVSASTETTRGAGHPPRTAFTLFDALSPIVTTAQNFDSLLTPLDHVSRCPSDTFYVDDTRLLRCHTSAHQVDLMRAGNAAFLVAGDVYRRDEIDASHYPVFHQMEGVRLFTDAEVRLALSVCLSLVLLLCRALSRSLSPSLSLSCLFNLLT